MKKEEYVGLEIEVIEFKEENIITESPTPIGGGDEDDD